MTKVFLSLFYIYRKEQRMIDLNRKFEQQLQRESTTVSDYFNDTTTCKMLFRRTNRGTNPQGKLHCYFKQTEPIGIGSVIVMKGQPYVIISDKDFDESNAVYSAIAQKTNVIINGIPFVIDTATYGESQGSIFTQVDGDVIIYTGYNTITNKIKVNNRINAFGNSYEVTNKFVKENILYVHIKQTTDIPDVYKIVYNGVTSFDIKESTTYQLSYTVTNNDIVVENPTITYSSSDETVATVDSNGLMTMLKEGSVDIVASCGGATCTTTMAISDTTPKVNYTTSISTSTDTIKVGGSYKTLTCLFADKNGQDITETVVADMTTADFTWTCFIDGTEFTTDSIVVWYKGSSTNTKRIKLTSAATSYLGHTMTVKCTVNGVTASKDLEITE